MPSLNKLSRELLELISTKNSRFDINNAKMTLAKKYGLKQTPLNSEILNSLTDSEKEKLLPFLTVKDARVLSGVNVIAVMSKPSKCPHGKCIFCPGGLDQNIPQSYTGFEPATMRAILNKFDPKKQVKNRISQLESIGHDVSKIELIIMGGTFNSTPKKYQKDFVKGIYDTLSNKKSKSFKDSKLNVEKSFYRPVGLTIETRPDICSKEDIINLLDLGATRIELGVQTLSNKIYLKVNRGHKLKDVITATQLLKDSGLKVLYHIMPGLFSSPKKDLKMFLKLFSDERFRPDMLKIYPALVMPGTKLYSMWENNEFEAYDDKKLFDFLKDFYPNIPYWNRVMRIQRDIPIDKVGAGPKKSNVREMIFSYFEKNKIELKEIRARQLGFKKSDCKEYDIFIEEYVASKGKEFFISYETKNRDQILGFIRLRFPYKPFIKELKNSALVRELHVYGKLVPINKNSQSIGQHKGIGKMLLAKAEEIASQNNFKKISVISGLGVREYYYKLGYYRDNFYVSKDL